ncbi:MAG: ABC transporter permease [Candidatus Omnitrophica bacterium]|nr:ABC transporter permease [Candidatus Omnitrophota bacterium]
MNDAVKHQSRTQLALAAFRRNRAAMLCFWVLAVLYGLAVFADVVCPYSYQDEDRDFSYCPPTAIEFMDHGHWVRPFVYKRTLTFDADHRRDYVIDRHTKYPLRFFHAGRLFTVDRPGRLYVWGADARGRDLFSRIWYGARISLSIGLLGVAISFALGLLIGGIAGYYGGWVDAVLMRLCEMFMMIPGFYLMLALRAAVPENFNYVEVYISVVVILALIGWASLARIIRGMALSLRERDYVLAAKTFGVPDLVIIVKHILPQTISYSMATLMLTVSSYILAEAGLSVVGLGIQDPIPSWGNLLSDAMSIVPVIFAPWILLPGLFIFIAVMCFNVIGDALRDAFDPMVEGSSIEN